MHARVVIFENALKTESVEGLRKQTVEKLRESGSFPPVQGLLTLGDFSTGRRLMITFWESEADLKAANEIYERMSVPYPEARRVSLEAYEVIQHDGFPADRG